MTTPTIWATYGNKCFIIAFIVTFVTPAMIIACLAAAWAYYQGGHITLWQECRVQDNQTHTSDGEKHRYCLNNTAKGPVFLELCRTMICFALVICAGSHYFPYHFGPIATPITTFKGQVKARLAFLCLIISGALVIFSAIVYDLNFHDYYSKHGKEKLNLQRGGIVLAAYICGSLVTACAIYMFIDYDTGLKAYIKSKLNALRSGNGSSIDARNVLQDVTVKSRFTIFCGICKMCSKCSKRKEGDNVDLRDGLTQTQVISIDNSSGYESTTASRCVSINQLNISVLSSSETGTNTQSGITSPVQQNEACTNPFPLLNFNGVGVRSSSPDLPDELPPSYEDVMKSDTYC